MFILINLLLLGGDFHPSNIATLQGKWAAGITVFKCDNFSVLWSPLKTFAVGLEGNISYSERKTDYTGEYGYTYESDKTGRLGLRLYQYLRTNSSLSPFISLSPYVQMQCGYVNNTYTTNIYPDDLPPGSVIPLPQSYYITNDTSYIYGTTLSPGIDYSFTLGGKQLSLKLVASLIDFSRTYHNVSSYYPEYEDTLYSSGVTNYWKFYLPTEMPVSIWLYLHF
jgi:hypothetical protein